MAFEPECQVLTLNSYYNPVSGPTARPPRDAAGFRSANTINLLLYIHVIDIFISTRGGPAKGVKVTPDLFFCAKTAGWMVHCSPKGLSKEPSRLQYSLYYTI